MPVSPEPGRSIHALVSAEAHKAWQDFGTEHGVSVSALLEALAEILPVLDPHSPLTPAKRSKPMLGLIRAARLVDSDRRHRGGHRKS